MSSGFDGVIRVTETRAGKERTEIKTTKYQRCHYSAILNLTAIDYMHTGSPVVLQTLSRDKVCKTSWPAFFQSKLAQSWD